jgi:phosphoribosylformylglycinamidine synthase
MLSNTVLLREADDATLMRLSKEGMLSLTLEEMKTIQTYFRRENRDPSDCELETLAQTWSEHCGHKTFKAAYEYHEAKLDGEKALAKDGPKTYTNLLKDTIAKATTDLSPSWCLSVFKDNAGVIKFDEETAVSFKVETHNHPSALEPYGGAGTGIGGVIRDVLGCGLGGKPVMNTDVFCFGRLEQSSKELPEGALHPKRIAKGVVSGVRDYGNRMGIPTSNGAIYFDPAYAGNPLVFCGTVGYMPIKTIEKTVLPGDLVVAVGGRTGRDGIHGATFSSAPLEKGITSSVVQIGHAIQEKKVLDVLLQARDKNLYRSVTDCGAGGFSSAVGELGSETGVKVNLAKAPLKYPGLAPWEIWVSESQERMVFAVPNANWAAFKALFEAENVEAVEIGEFTSDKRLTVMYGDEVVASLDMEFLHNGTPKLHLKAKWDVAEYRAKHVSKMPGAAALDVPKTFRALLAHPVIASKESVIRQYDHEVQGGSIVKPLMGAQFDGPTDAAVFRPNLKSWRGVAVSNGMNPEIGKWDPYLMAKYAVDEAVRNLVAVGGGLTQTAILDNFCWGDSKDPIELAALVRASEGCYEAAMAYQTPFISGKDSFNNTWRAADGTLHSIPCTLLVSAIGVLENVRTCVTPGLKGSGNLLYLVGRNGTSLTGSLAAQVWGNTTGLPQDFSLEEAKSVYKRLQAVMRKNLVLSCHDVSDGGLAVAAAEMAFGGTVGAELELPADVSDIDGFLFNEAPARFVVEVAPSHKLEFEQSFDAQTVKFLGQTVKKTTFTVRLDKKTVIEDTVEKLKTIWKTSLEAL